MTAEMHFYIIFSSGGTSEKCPAGKEHSTLQRTVLKRMEMLETSLLKTQRIFKFCLFFHFPTISEARNSHADTSKDPRNKANSY